MRQRALNILFINPSLRLGSVSKFLPVGIGSVMTFIKSHGYDFDLLDVDIHDHDNAYVEQYVSDHKYDIIMTGSIAAHYKWIKWLTKTIKEYHPETKVIVGNSVAGSIPNVFLNNSRADVAVIGEGEYTALELLNAYRENKSIESIQGIAFKNTAGEIIQTPKRTACDINDLPVVDWKLFDYKKYFETSDHAGAAGLIFDESNAPRVMPVATARGCAFRCTFCHFVFWDDPYRYRTPENILIEIKRNIEEYGATYINFWDDLSFAGLKQAENMADAILNSGLKFDWNASIRTDLFGNPRHSYEKRLEVAKKFKASGCINLGFSLESGNQEILDMMDKVVKVEYFAEQIKVLKEVGITCATSVVFGYPIETKETIQETFDMCLESGVYPSIGYLLPLPYTGMYEYGKKHGFIVDEDAYLDSITERQDLCLNMTQMRDQEVMDCIKEGASRLNEKMKLGLDADSLIKTGGPRKHIRETAEVVESLPIDPENLKVNENDFSFNYSQAIFDIDLGTGTEASDT